MSYSVSASNYEAAANELSRRLIQFDATVPYRACDYVFQTERERFCALCGSQTPSAEAWNVFHVDVISQTFATEKLFEIALCEIIVQARPGFDSIKPTSQLSRTNSVVNTEIYMRTSLPKIRTVAFWDNIYRFYRKYRCFSRNATFSGTKIRLTRFSEH